MVTKIRDRDKEMIGNLRWEAVVTRSDEAAAAAGHFIYAVTTTGIYCRPGCASRTPLRRNVTFFETPQQAAEAGFRPCRRCRPDKDTGDDPGIVLAVAACRRLEIEEPEPGLENLADDAGLSPAHFQKTFKAVIGLSPHDYAAAIRSGRLLKALADGRNVTEAVYEAGYSAPSRAYEEWKGRSGLSPGEHRRGGSGLTMDFTTVPWLFGWILVAVTDRGLASVFLGDTPEGMVHQLRDQFPSAVLREIPPSGSEVIRRAVAALDHPDRWTNLPLDIRGTSFQKQVWKALQEVPPGGTSTYAEIAAGIGRPTAVRAVAKACGSNNIALFIPCHRIIRSDGRPGGYRWGTDRKLKILEEERWTGSPQTGKTV